MFSPGKRTQVLLMGKPKRKGKDKKESRIVIPNRLHSQDIEYLLYLILDKKKELVMKTVRRDIDWSWSIDMYNDVEKKLIDMLIPTLQKEQLTKSDKNGSSM